MATLFDLAQQYLNRALPETFRYDRTNQPGIPTPVPKPVVPEPIKQLPRPGGNAEGFSVYNPDPNSISNKNYSPYAYRQAAERSLIGDFYSSGTEAQKMMDNYPDYYQGPQLTGIPGAIANYAKNSLAGQLLGKAASGLESLLPVNRRAIYENELAGQGIMVNDIGQIVSDGGNINTAQNIMAGYNAAKVDADTFAKRRAVIEKNMKDPVQKAAKLKALDEAEAIMLGTAKKRTDMITEQKLIEKDPSLKGPEYLEDAFDFTTETPSFLTDNTIASNNIIGGTNLNDYDGITSAYTPSPGDLGYISPTAPITSGSVLADKNINKIIDDVEIPSSGNDNNAGFNPGVTPGNSGFIGIDKDMDVSPFDFDDAGTYEPPSNNYPDYSNVKTGGPPSQGGSSGGSPGQGGTHCCTAANKRGDMTLTEVKKLRAWHRKQSKIWQKGYDVWGRVIADNLVAKFKWQSDRVRDFYNHKIYGKKTIGSIYADIVIYPMSMIIGFILTVMPPILGYQENKRHG